MSTSAQGGEYAQFKATFFEECNEILADLDARLTRLQSETIDSEELNAIFRAVHSIKAGAGAFGLTDLVQFSHAFEALLDRLRDGRVVQDDRVSAVVVRAGDIVATLVGAAQADQPVEAHLGEDVVEELRALMDEADRGAGDPAAIAAPAPATERAPAAPTAVAGTSRYRIVFQPHAELFRHANEPLLLIREMKRLGALEVTLHSERLPPLETIEPEDAYLAWTFELTTERPRGDIEEVFEFVDADCDLTIELIEPAAATAGTAEAETSASEPAEPVAASEAPVAATRTPATPAAIAAAVAAQTPVQAASSPTAPSPAAAAPGAAAQNAKGGASSIRVDLTRVDRLVNMVGELVITQAMLAQQIQDQAGADHENFRGTTELATLTRELQECVMAIRMQPVKSVFARMPRLVREVSAKLGKHVRLVMHGEQTEVDKTVIEELADPLTHMIRNSIDHGIEDPDTRVARGKPVEGTIELSAAHVGSNILIHIQDDGAGIDRERLLRKAIEKGIVAEGDKLTDEQIDDLIFSPGFSTAAQVTDVSGRGVGMDVVRRNVVNLGGRIQVQSQVGRGTRFTMIIPLTLAVLDGMLVAVGREKYILPLTSILESYQPDRNQVTSLAGGGELTSIRGEFYRLIYLHRVFHVPGAVTEAWKGIVVLVETASGERIGIAVDELLGQQQVVIKSLQENFDPVPGISGATILGNGRVALILDIEQLTLAGRNTARRPEPTRSDPAQAGNGAAPETPAGDPSDERERMCA